jgi:ParB-like nuclease domain
MTRLRIADLFTDSFVDPEAHLDLSRVEHYSRMLAILPPVVVFDTPEGLLLADGYHRVAAARRLGLETVEAEVRKGSRHDALRYAAGVGAAQRGISQEEAASHIERRTRERRDERGTEAQHGSEQECADPERRDSPAAT